MATMVWLERIPITAHHTLLLKRQARSTLVAAETVDDVWERHVAGSAQLFHMLGDDVAHVADLGSGAGFPGLVLALMARDAGRKSMFHLVESDSRKAAFLIEAALALKLFNQNAGPYTHLTLTELLTAYSSRTPVYLIHITLNTYISIYHLIIID